MSSSEGAEVDGAVAEVRSALLGGELTLTAGQVAAAAGVSRDLTKRLWRAMGFADIPDDEAAFTQEDLEALRRTGAMMERDDLGEGDVLHLARVLGLATARMADSVVSFTLERMAGGDHPIDGAILEELDHLVVYLLNRNLAAAVERYLPEHTPGAGDGDAAAVLAVGFADLVGFTRLSQRLTDTELAGLIEEFEATASDAIVVNGGRVVKMIGDEVMWCADPPVAVEIALLLAESFDDPDRPSVRVGLASGGVITRAGDLFGPTVNLAARATGMARAGSVLVAEDMFPVVESDPRYHLRRLRPRRLKGIGWANLAAVSRDRHRPEPSGSAPGDPPAASRDS
ncbi:adenylate/guanylate cyclase domain-containing protein [Acidiferrimicrobium sp. IK]|uniref:adenylate/guanylate cyclase domain-containing protein n=1 Tax=Acidiferrimicrobium sp. IK TaxID=2871700 RepID=UPI0021CB30D9|nr:adenylate/guanylate cyclase domain-containing protein [Acidiferrimicrobium sp. IK]MCU4185321.1 adenylate/guanylate cyclase domain-containing protein [Acidiferrimicrobium sp. IK]